YILWIELFFAEGAFAADRLERGVHYELGYGRIATNVALPGDVQVLCRNLTDHVPQVEIGISHVLYILAAYVAQIAGLALRHDPAPNWSKQNKAAHNECINSTSRLAWIDPDSDGFWADMAD